MGKLIIGVYKIEFFFYLVELLVHLNILKLLITIIYVFKLLTLVKLINLLFVMHILVVYINLPIRNVIIWQINTLIRHWSHLYNRSHRSKTIRKWLFLRLVVNWIQLRVLILLHRLTLVNQVLLLGLSLRNTFMFVRAHVFKFF
jgi:hypothetical protein